jgi:HlyD family secretion protein
VKRTHVLGGLAGLCVLFALIRAPGTTTTTEAATPQGSKKSGGGFTMSFGGDGGGDGRRVETLTPRRGPIASTIECAGTVQAGSEAGISAPFEGKVCEIVRDVGDRVAEGEVLFKLDPTELEEKALEAELDLSRKRSARLEAEVELHQTERKFADAEQEPSDVTEARLKVRQGELQAQRATAQLESAASKRDRSRQMLAQGIATPIDVESAESEHRVAEIGVRIAQEELSLARETLTFRERTWGETRASAAKDLEVTRARLERAASDLKTADVALARARRDVDRAQGRAPLDGVVTGRGVNLGDQVSRVTGETTHFIVSDLEHVLVYCDVDEGDVVRVAAGQRATARVNAVGDEVRLEGRVYDVGLRGTVKQGQEVTTFRVRVLLSPGQAQLDRLRPGMTSTCVIETAREDAAYKLPLQAVVQRELRSLSDATRARAPKELLEGKRPFDLVDLAFFVEGGKAVARVIRSGLQDEDEVSLALGAPEGTPQVIVGPFRALEKLEDGEAVKAETAEVALPPDDGVAAVTSAP